VSRVGTTTSRSIAFENPPTGDLGGACNAGPPGTSTASRRGDEGIAARYVEEPQRRRRARAAATRRAQARFLLAASLLLVPGMAPSGLAGQERPIVVLDPGHGGPQPGVVVGDLLEKDLVLRLAFVTAAEFVNEGYDVRLTRTGDYAVANNDRRAQAEEAGAALFISLHMIRSDDPARHGAEIYFSQEVPASVRAAGIFAEAMEQDGVVVVQEARTSPFLASPAVPTVMIEAGFLTHPVEQRFLVSDDYHRRLARVFVQAAERVLEGR
jgi:N-acetylmuramoyl-L-alanine amidase